MSGITQDIEVLVNAVIAASGNIYDTNSVTTFVDESQSSVLLLASNSSRVDVWLTNTSSKDMYFSYDTNATTTTGIKLKRNASINIKDVRGAIYGVWKNGANKGVSIIETSIV